MNVEKLKSILLGGIIAIAFFFLTILGIENFIISGWGEDLARHFSFYAYPIIFGMVLATSIIVKRITLKFFPDSLITIGLVYGSTAISAWLATSMLLGFILPMDFSSMGFTRGLILMLIPLEAARELVPTLFFNPYLIIGTIVFISTFVLYLVWRARKQEQPKVFPARTTETQNTAFEAKKD